MIQGEISFLNANTNVIISDTMLPPHPNPAKHSYESPLRGEGRLKIPPFDRLRVVSEVEAPEAGVRGKSSPAKRPDGRPSGRDPSDRM